MQKSTGLHGTHFGSSTTCVTPGSVRDKLGRFLPEWTHRLRQEDVPTRTQLRPRLLLGDCREPQNILKLRTLGRRQADDGHRHH